MGAGSYRARRGRRAGAPVRHALGAGGARTFCLVSCGVVGPSRKSRSERVRHCGPARPPERSLRRVCDMVFEYGPKTLASIHRLQHALHLARSGRPLGEASAMAGYVDQSHLNRDARRMAGATPERGAAQPVLPLG
ncbi:helix-turn-helix domain-containing protein [Streptomyces sp. NBC_01012]|uniref:helix-turn-helix domain-containing protein n=1 Tax=Streptomyces sp. NBC_01012 TaxID=2903717 RepID=UPI00386C7FA7|nr:helix-turn-helix domain-containing protein [Streptomyces sp. NBC_01012]